MISPKDEVEKKIFEIWKELTPSGAFTGGLVEYAGRLFVPTEENIRKSLKKIAGMKVIAKDESQRKLLSCLETGLKFEEPCMVPKDALWTFYRHLVKEGISARHFLSLADYTEKALEAHLKRLGEREWPLEIKILTCNASNGLLGILKTIEGQTKDEELKKRLKNLEKNVENYCQAFYVEGVEEGDFTEVFPILKAKGGYIERERIYPRILRDMYDFSETADEIEDKGLKWLRKEMPELRRVTGELAKIYGVKPTVEAVTEELTKRRRVEKPKAIEFVKHLREKIVKVIKSHLVDITPRYDTRIVETPPYLVNFIPTAAMTDFDILTDRPFNVFFVTTDERRSPASSAPDLLQSLIHEEYGHCVNFSNSATHFAAKPSLVEMLDTSLHRPITEGIAFYREYEYLTMLKRLTSKKRPTPEEKEFLDVLGKGVENMDTVILETEFIVTKWRILRFLRAIGDVRINMGKQTVAEFVEWGYKQTGLSEKMVYNQMFIFLDNPGYAPVYFVAGESLREIHRLAVKKGKSALDFNTYASSLGFPARTIFEKRLRAYATSG